MSGSVTINGINDKELIIVLEVKERHEGKMGFNPQQMQAANTAGNPLKQIYNNVILTWQEHVGLDGVKEILHRLSTEAPYMAAPPKP